ncbi:uncharacterized protein LOC117377836 [Periophthalmus magnuspinnatus]|uniref:uncharacterized protein LOC117377836 n=1 Tax=Periophthalmus magnuspinnatus TaxID=409849 RepID=UPI002436B2C5|nr:uncharacterized protein LOC117377836 [Periophthalmus magnuspinnatus]
MFKLVLYVSGLQGTCMRSVVLCQSFTVCPVWPYGTHPGSSEDTKPSAEQLQLVQFTHIYTQESMRRFFRAHREEDYSQIQYLTAKCTRLAHDKAMLDREFVVSRDRERKLQTDVEAVTTRLLQQEQVNMELRMKQDQLVGRLQQQQDLVEVLQQRLGLVTEESSRDAELLRQVGSELLFLQSSELRLQGLVEELHAEAHHRATLVTSLEAELHNETKRRVSLAKSLQEELHSKTWQLEQLQEANQTLVQELKELHSSHQKEVHELQVENEGSLRKLQATAEQFEWLCQQQRYWVCCVKRFKDGLVEERDALLQQVKSLQKMVQKRKKILTDDITDLRCPLQETCSCDSLTAWNKDTMADLESHMEKSNILYDKLFSQTCIADQKKK